MKKWHILAAIICIIFFVCLFLFDLRPTTKNGSSPRGISNSEQDSTTSAKRTDSGKTNQKSIKTSSENQTEDRLTEKKILSTADMISAVASASEPGEMFRLIRTACMNGNKDVGAVLLETWQELQKLKNDPLIEDRYKALLVGFALSNEFEGIPLAEEILNNDTLEPKTRMYALQTIASLGGQAPVDFALKYIDAKDRNLKSRAIEALGLIGDDTVVPELERIAQEEALVYRRAAEVSMIQIEAANLTGVEKIDYIKNELIECPHSISLVMWGVHALKGMDTPEAMEALKTLADFQSDTSDLLNNLSSQALK